MTKMLTYSYLVKCYFQRDCKGDSRIEEFGCCEPVQRYASEQGNGVPCRNW